MTTRDTTSRLDEAKADLIAKAARIVDHGELEERAVSAFLRRYYRHVAPEDLLGRAPEDVFGAATSQRRMAASRPPGTAAVRVFTPTVEGHGWACGHTVVEVATDDMPFLVDSVTSQLQHEGLGVHLVIHPTLHVRRTPAGDLLPDETSLADAQDVVESWIHVEIDRQSDPNDLVMIEAHLIQVLTDVRASVEDWDAMRAQAETIAASLADNPPVTVADEVEETVALLRWLADDHFTFLGYREYDLVTEDGLDGLAAHHSTGLGILRADVSRSSSFDKLPPKVRQKAREPHLLLMTKANSRATVHRPAYLDYVGIKTFDADGNVVGERRFLGLLNAGAYTEPVRRIPVIRRKAAAVIARSGFAPTSHAGKELSQILETFPRDELFATPVEILVETCLAVHRIGERRQARLFLRRDEYGRFISCLVYLPRDRYTTTVRLRVENMLREAFDGASVDYTARVTESVLARVHFVVRVKAGHELPDVDAEGLEARLADATRSWNDDFSDALVEVLDEDRSAGVVKRYLHAFPEAYKEDVTPRAAVADVRALEALTVDSDGVGIAVSMYEPLGAFPGERRFKIYRSGGPVSLTTVLPVLQRMGVEVTDERPYAIERGGPAETWIYDFGLRYDPTVAAIESTKATFQDAFLAIWQGEAEVDGFNALVLQAGLTWRQAMVLRALARYLRQAGTMFSQDYIETCLRSNAITARLLVALFETRCDPDRYVTTPRERTVVTQRLMEQIQAALDLVASLDQDRILRALLSLVTAIMRTNAFQYNADGSAPAVLAFKFDPAILGDLLPKPRPQHEIWVHSPKVEGVHLRFGRVARGGLRWSDRREDFRTEVLGLVKAQAVKNSVIVPVGAKGGFVVRGGTAALNDREAVLAEGIDRYKLFVSAMLDLTDNLVDGQVVPPRRVVRHDGDDSYLVVAADKGTATFSDIANQISADHGFWLGDAFASGGSVGYDHKVMGITARGAWESVKRHFRELGVNTQSDDITVVGVGDMSGDVFGNGMLLSDHLKLVAAFDHRHIFFDPDPDPASSFAERARLFALPRSSWADYDQSLISAGGGVFPRILKSIPITDAVRALLGLPAGALTLTPAELMRAILTAPVDLLWNGGIGTYVKSSTESHASVGDKANDAIRVDGVMLACRVVGEGGNLGFTQLGRIEAARLGHYGDGVRVNTDAIDNSAGVDCSDHEVNIKILLDRVVAAGDMTRKQRDSLLAEMTDEVAELVLRDNYEQNVLLGNARAQSASMLSVHRRYIRDLVARGELDRLLEFLPDQVEMERRVTARDGLTSPEFAVLVAYTKNVLAPEVLASALPDEAWYQLALTAYFPPQIRERLADKVGSHPLRREIITTSVVNDLVNRGGISFVFRCQEETGAEPADVVRAFTVLREVFRLGSLWDNIESLDNVIPTVAQTAMYLDSRRLVDRGSRWLLQTRGQGLDVHAEIDRFQPVVSELTPLIPSLLRGAERERLARGTAELVAKGAPAELAEQIAGLLDAFSLLDVTEIALSSGQPAKATAQLYFAVSERYDVDRFLGRITALPRDDRWASLARSALRADLYAALAGITRSVAARTPADVDPVERIVFWEEANAAGLGRARATLRDIALADTFDLATLSVALRVMRQLVPTRS